MRQAIDNHILDRKAPPRTLQDLGDSDYLFRVPVDPITGAADWRVHITDTRLSSKPVPETASDGTRYDTWYPLDQPDAANPQ